MKNRRGEACLARHRGMMLSRDPVVLKGEVRWAMERDDIAQRIKAGGYRRQKTYDTFGFILTEEQVIPSAKCARQSSMPLSTGTTRLRGRR